MYKGFVLFALVSSFYVTAARAAPSDDALKIQLVSAFTAMTLANEANATSIGQSGFFDPVVPLPTPVEQVIADWKKNAISASKKYQSKTTRVVFTLHKVSLSGEDVPILESEVPRSPLPDIVAFEFPKAGDKDVDYLGGLIGGMKVEAVCFGKIQVLGSPGGPDTPGLAGSIMTFKNCRTVSASLDLAYNWFNDALKQWASGEVDAAIAKTGSYEALLSLVARSYDATNNIPTSCVKFLAVNQYENAPVECKEAIGEWYNAPTSDSANAFMSRTMPRVKS